MKYAIILLLVTLTACAPAQPPATAPSAVPAAAAAPALQPSAPAAVQPSPTQHAHQHSACQRDLPAATTLISGLGTLDHPVSTDNQDAQRFFNQGLTLYYAFNDEEALRSFKRASELDPQLAMAHWGLALSVGPNINIGIDSSCEQYAYQQIQIASELAKSERTSPQDRAYIDALARRYTSVGPELQFDLVQLAVDYKVAMAALAQQYPDDPDAGTLYAESIMDLRPWQIWYNDGTPKHETEEMIAQIERVLKQHPDHIGANHFYIHALEASGRPQAALDSAELLPTLAPAAGHLVHMPSHIYMRIGAYERAVESNLSAVALDQSGYAPGCQQSIDAATCDSIYVGHYLTHNLQFLAESYAMQGNFEHAYAAGRQVADNVSRYIGEQPELERYLVTPARLLVAFGKWDMLLDQAHNPPPPPGLPIAASVWHWSRAMAYAATGALDQARAEQVAFDTAASSVPATASWGNNPASSMLELSGYVLSARIARAQGQAAVEITFLKLAVDAEDGLVYDEPPPWFYATRQALGGALYRSGEDYAEAEQAFREDLAQHPDNGRALFGLFNTLAAQGRTAEAQEVERAFELAWKNADIQLSMQDL